MTQCAVQREHNVAHGKAPHGNEVPKGKPAVGLLQKMRGHHQQMQVTKKKKVPGCAGNIGTGNDSGCPLAKLPTVMFELMVFKGTADLCILLTGNE